MKAEEIAKFTAAHLHNFPGVISPKKLAWAWEVSVEVICTALDLLVARGLLEKHGPAYTKPIKSHV